MSPKHSSERSEDKKGLILKSGKPFLLRPIAINLLIILVTILVGLALGEVLLRVKNSNQMNYNIEMWRYSRTLKMPSSDPILGHQHRPGRSAVLQGVEIRLNKLGMRGLEPDFTDTTRKRILVLGSSNTLGWGVEEKDTLCGRLQRVFGDQVQFFNAGIGNYNTVRYVHLFQAKLQNLKPDIVVVHYFINDAEVLQPGGGNILLRHSQLAVTLYRLMQSLKHAGSDIGKLVDHYRQVYTPDSEGRIAMEAALESLEQISEEQGFQVILAMTPDIHQLDPYPFEFVHRHMRALAARHGWTYVDFTDPLRKVPSKDLWAIPGDPHLNSLGHQIMTETLAPYLVP